MTVFDRIKILADKRGISVSKVAIDLGFSENLFYQWKTASPKSDRLEKVADYFGVSVDYLLGRNQTPEWAEQEDVIKLDQILKSNAGMAYGDEDEITQEDRERIDDLIAGYFWTKKKKENKKHKEG